MASFGVQGPGRLMERLSSEDCKRTLALISTALVVIRSYFDEKKRGFAMTFQAVSAMELIDREVGITLTGV